MKKSVALTLNNGGHAYADIIVEDGGKIITKEKGKIILHQDHRSVVQDNSDNCSVGVNALIVV